MAQMNPPIKPPNISGATSAISRDRRKRCHVHQAVAIAQSSRTPVLFTVPLSVIRLVRSVTPPYWLPERSRNVFSPNAGLDVFISAIVFSPYFKIRDVIVSRYVVWLCHLNLQLLDRV